ncbi:MAG: signal peptide peptidase SppA [Planctomycetota bacterium]|nr:signal peptide peptidase SppA [Planctomycetota bacterium]
MRRQSIALRGRERRAGGPTAGALLALLMLPAGCLPNRVVIDLSGSAGALTESTVLIDGGRTATGPKVALIDVSGVISHAARPGLLISGGGNTVDDLVTRLDRAEKDPEVRAVVLRVNSPGGTVAASDTMFEEIKGFRARSKKPVVVSMAEVAASGGYYISLAGDRIFAQPSSVTGSIGVIVQTVNFSKGMSMVGVEARAVTSGPNKALASPFEPAKEPHYAILQSTVDDFYAGFVRRVREGRPGIAEEKVASIADGRIFTGTQALEAGLVDELGGLREAYASARGLAGLERARLITYHGEGYRPGSPYAMARAADGGAASAGPGSSGAGDAASVSINISGDLLPRTGFYYLWTGQ